MITASQGGPRALCLPWGIARAFTAKNEPLGINTRNLGRFMVWPFVQLPTELNKEPLLEPFLKTPKA